MIAKSILHEAGASMSGGRDWPISGKVPGMFRAVIGQYRQRDFVCFALLCLFFCLAFEDQDYMVFERP